MIDDIVVYTKTGCPYCQQLMEEYQQKGIPFKEVNVSMDAKAKTLVKNVLLADKVPVIVKNGELESIGYKGKG